jgi:uncharacterized repeat protein (TIGR01451 family)
VAGQTFYFPERIGVVDVIPNSESGETDQNSEPSLGVGPGAQKLVLHAFASGWQNPFFTSTDGGMHWTVSETYYSTDVTLDWNQDGPAYAAIQPIPVTELNVFNSSDPSAGVKFNGGSPLVSPWLDQPWLAVANVNGVDHICIALNKFDNVPRPRTATILVSVNGGGMWQTTILEKGTPTGGQDVGVRTAVYGDGQRVYAAFYRFKSSVDGDEVSDLIVVRDDNGGLGGFNVLPINGNGGNDGVHDTQVVRDIVVALGEGNYGTSLGSERLGSDCSIAIHPSQPDIVYVAYAEVLNDSPFIRVQCSTDGGKTFQLVYSAVEPSALPALAVAADGTVGLLFATLVNGNMEVHFFKAAKGNFNQTKELVLASFPDNDPNRQYDPYLGDYFQLRTLGDSFYGTFCASGEPKPSHFPTGVYYQRNVMTNGVTQSDFWLSTNGTLVDLGNNPVAASIDPFFFYDIAPSFLDLPVLEYVPSFFFDPSDPLARVAHLRWAVLPPNYRQFRLQSAPQLGASGGWSEPTDINVLQANGLFYAPLGTGLPQRFFRLSQDAASGQFPLFASVDAHGTLEPSGMVVKNGLEAQTFTATPATDYAIGKWYLDGVSVQSNSPSLTLSNITAEHTVMVTFVASNDLAVTIGIPPGPVVVNSNFDYLIHIQNAGINPLTQVVLTDSLPATVTFVSASSSQGTVGQSPPFPSLVIGNLGAIAPGQSATVTVTVTANSAGAITNTATVACGQVEPNLANNTATDILSVVDPVAITFQPISQSVSAGGTVSFNVEVSGSPPFTYQWYFDGAPVTGGTGTALTLTNVAATQAGTYSVTVFQFIGPDDPDVFEADSDEVTLTVGP